ncbi:LysR family substrate-binding domain-containing protein [Streptomyces sp. 205]|uniref:LysR family substrate-binding domain-containing protein n=1 Tax=Streptomyces coffeae TaxID=621382 RepID=A0ABS1NRF7_9ACTN|nr:LysR family substrate-binding domain-containing protein [Streptomyces coffeae]
MVIGTLTAEPAMPHTKDLLEELHAHHPGLAIEMRSLNFVNQYEALARGEVDVAFLRPPAPPGIQTLHLTEEPRVVCLPADDPLAVHERISLAQISDHTFVTMPPESPRVWRDFWAINPRPDGKPIRFGPLAVDVEGVLHLVARGQVNRFPACLGPRILSAPGYSLPGSAGRAPPCTMALSWLAKNRDRPDITLIRNITRTFLTATGPSRGARCPQPLVREAEVHGPDLHRYGNIYRYGLNTYQDVLPLHAGTEAGFCMRRRSTPHT